MNRPLKRKKLVFGGKPQQGSHAEQSIIQNDAYRLVLFFLLLLLLATSIPSPLSGDTHFLHILKNSNAMAILDDATLLVKKIFVTVIIYLVPVTIVVGGLLLTEKILQKPVTANSVIQSTSKPE